MTVAGQSSSQKITVVNDPHSHGDPAEIEQLYQTAQAVLHQVSQLDVALNRMDAIEAQVKALQLVAKGSPDEPDVKAAVENFEKQMKAVHAVITSNAAAAESTVKMPDKIREHLIALDGLLEGADYAPRPAVLEQKQFLQPEYEAAIQRFNQFVQTDAAAFNSAMSAHKLTGVVAGETLQP
jgi:hypothetical protein